VIAALRSELPVEVLPGVVEGLSPALSDLFSELLALDRPVTLRDDDLLARLGNSPNTVRRRLNALAEAGLVVKLTDRTGQPGRPAVAYQVRRSAA